MAVAVASALGQWQQRSSRILRAVSSSGVPVTSIFRSGEGEGEGRGEGKGEGEARGEGDGEGDGEGLETALGLGLGCWGVMHWRASSWLARASAIARAWVSVQPAAAPAHSMQTEHAQL